MDFAKKINELGKNKLPEFFPWICKANPCTFLVSQQAVDDGQAEAIEFVRKPLHHVRTNKFNLKRLDVLL
jgi:hypothetical protein